MILGLRRCFQSISWVIHATFLLVIASVAFAADYYHGELACHVGPYMLHVPKSLKALRSIGELKSDRILDVEDFGKDGKVEIRELVFDGLKIIIDTSPDGTSYDVGAVTITSPRWKIANGFRIGDRIEDVVKQLGGKGERKGNWLKVSGDSHSISFKVLKGRVVEIRYACGSP